MARQIDLENDQRGQRLDAALRKILPHFGLRAIRRLLKNGMVLVNDVPGHAALKLKGNEKITILPASPARGPLPRILSERGGFLFIYKPAGLHTAALAGASGPSLESWLKTARPGATLLQRLDKGTSGLITAATSMLGAALFRQAEAEGQIRKYYLAALKGQLACGDAAKAALATANRKKTKVLDKEARELYWTKFQPICFWERSQPGIISLKEPATLVLCRIKKGQRHQIRAHAASLGFPLYGDSLYGGGQEGFMLEQCFISLPWLEQGFFGPRSLFGRLDAALREKISQQIKLDLDAGH